MGDSEEVLCGACCEPVDRSSKWYSCGNCGDALHHPDSCSDVWHPHDELHFCNKKCASAMLKSQRAVFVLQQRMPSASPAAAAEAAAPSPASRHALPFLEAMLQHKQGEAARNAAIAAAADATVNAMLAEKLPELAAVKVNPACVAMLGGLSAPSAAPAPAHDAAAPAVATTAAPAEPPPPARKRRPTGQIKVSDDDDDDEPQPLMPAAQPPAAPPLPQRSPRRRRQAACSRPARWPCLHEPRSAATRPWASCAGAGAELLDESERTAGWMPRSAHGRLDAATRRVSRDTAGWVRCGGLHLRTAGWKYLINTQPARYPGPRTAGWLPAHGRLAALPPSRQASRRTGPCV